MTRSRSSWSMLADIRGKVRRRWGDGTLLRAYAVGEPFPVIEVPLRRPRASEIGDDLGAVPEWVADGDGGSRRGSHYDLTQ